MPILIITDSQYFPILSGPFPPVGPPRRRHLVRALPLGPQRSQRVHQKKQEEPQQGEITIDLTFIFQSLRYASIYYVL